MNLSEYGPFASIIAIAAALVAVFSLLLLKAMGTVARWTWLIEDTPSFMVTVGARAAAIALIGVCFISINQNNYRVFATLAVLFGACVLVLISWFDSLRRRHTCAIPIVQANGKQALRADGKAEVKQVVIGAVRDMRPAAKAEYKKHPALTPCKFLSGYGENEVNNPSAVWDSDLLAGIAHKMTMILMGIMLSAVMALYLTASSIEVHQRPATEAHASG